LFPCSFDFTDSEGTTTETGCAPWGTDAACQVAINQNDWCTNYQPDAPSVSVTYDNAGTLGITVNSDKTLIGEGSAGVIKGKGLRLVSGTSNVIIQYALFSPLTCYHFENGHDNSILLPETSPLLISTPSTSGEVTPSL
jgi:pectate lyase